MIPARCPVCGSSEVEQLLNVESAPALCNALWPSTAEALDAPAGPIDLSLCVACSHVWNPSFEAELVAYSPAYDNSLHFSAKFQKYAADLADHLIETYSVRGRQIVEIGSREILGVFFKEDEKLKGFIQMRFVRGELRGDTCNVFVHEFL